MASVWNELKRRNVVRVAAAYLALSWLVVQIIETLFPMFGLADATARVIVIALAIGLIPALVSAWVFELTPDGLKRDAEVDHDSMAGRAASRRLDRLVMLLLVLGISYFAVDKFLLDPARDEAELQTATAEARQEGRAEATIETFGDKSIAVLPFVNMSSDPEQEYFADGISEELLNLLARIPELRVISRTSAFALKGQDLGIPSIAKKLNVAHILEGSVRKSGNSIRITAQLIEAGSDRHLWSETYDRTLDDVFAIQDEVAAHVVEQLRLKLVDGSPRAKTVNPRAYDLFLQARSITSLSDDARFPSAVLLLRQALVIEPDYVDAMLLLSYASDDEAEGIALDQRVLELDPDNATLKAVSAFDPVDGLGDRHRAARLLEEAAATDPSDSVMLFYAAQLAQSVGKLDHAIEIYEFVVARDPLLFWAHLNLADFYTHAGRIDDALRSYELALSLNQTEGAVYWKYGLALLINGEPDKAEAQFEQDDFPYRDHGLVLAYNDLGRLEESRALLEELVEKEAEPWPFGLARAYAWLGDADSTFHYLERGRETGISSFGGLGAHPLFDKVHDDPRWLPFLQSVGQAPEQLAEFEFDIHIPKQESESL